jgi:hypothetical protein
MKDVLMLLILTGGLVVAGSVTELRSLAQLQWQHRVILVWTVEQGDYLQQLVEAREGVDDRDILWFVISGEKLRTNYQGRVASDFLADLTRRFGKPSESVVLIGKDGGVKRKRETLSLSRLFKDIDAMPMRKIEIKTKQNK